MKNSKGVITPIAAAVLALLTLLLATGISGTLAVSDDTLVVLESEYGISSGMVPQ